MFDRYLLFVLLLFSLIPGIVLADTENASSFWFMSLSRARFSESVEGYLDFHPRTSIDDVQPGQDGNVRQLISRAALGWRLTESMTLFQGYGLIAGYAPKQTEHRSFQELLIRHSWSDSNLMHRFRFEQRLLERRSGASLRGRYFFRLQHPLPVDSLSLALNEELFVTLNEPDDAIQTGFDQNRLFLGVNYALSESTSIDFGYQNQYVGRRGGVADISNHTLFLGVFKNFDFR